MAKKDQPKKVRKESSEISVSEKSSDDKKGLCEKESSEEAVQKSVHLSEKNEFLGWKKTTISLIREKGKSKNN